MRQLCATLCFALTALSTSSGTAASEATRCQILTVQASNAGTGVSKSLEKYAHLFEKQPFSAYNTFDLVARDEVTLSLDTTKPLTLPNNIGGSLSLNGLEGKQLDLTLQLFRDKQSPITIRGFASPGAPLIAAGMKSPKGIWVFGIICTDVDGHVTF